MQTCRRRPSSRFCFKKENQLLRKISQDTDVIHIVEFIKNRFYFVIFKTGRTKFNTPELHYFSIDDKLVYKGYYTDFGPLHLGHLYKYACLLDSKLRSDWLRQKAIIHYTKSEYNKQANSAFLAGAFAVMFLKLTSVEVWKLLTFGQMRYTPFRDASYSHAMGLTTPTITILDCLRAIEKAVKLNFLNFKDFDALHYSLFEVQGYSELNWIVPERMIAFCNPGEDKGSPVNLNRLIKYFKYNNVGTVVRLNIPDYNSKKFSFHGIQHYDLFFEDGTPPSFEILEDFFKLSENSTKAVAVHCKAGLGRTGCLIGAFLVKYYGFRANEAIAWMRMCRPGMVVGIQNSWLRNIEEWLWRSGDNWRHRNYKSKNQFPTHEKPIYTTRYNAPTDIIENWIKDVDKQKEEKLRRNLQGWTNVIDEKRPMTQGDFLLALRKIRQAAMRSQTR